MINLSFPETIYKFEKCGQQLAISEWKSKYTNERMFGIYLYDGELLSTLSMNEDDFHNFINCVKPAVGL